MAAGPKLDGAGAAKLETLEDALAQLQRIHAMVERMAIAARTPQGAAPLVAQLKRTATPLVGQLRGQFGLIADQVAAMLLAASRGGSDQTRVRGLREGVAQIRTAIEIAIARVKEKHTIDAHAAGPPPEGRTP